MSVPPTPPGIRYSALTPMRSGRMSLPGTHLPLDDLQHFTGMNVRWIERQRVSIVRRGSGEIVGLGAYPAAVVVDHVVAGVQLLGLRQRIQSLLPARSLGVDHADLRVDMRGGVERRGLPQFGHRPIGLVRAIVGQTPIHQQAVVRLLHARRFRILRYRVVATAVGVVSVRQLKVHALLAGRFARSVFPYGDVAGPKLVAL